MKSLTKREKILLYTLLCFVIVIGGIMLCLPAMETYNELKIKNDSLSANLNTLKASIVKYEDLDKKIEEATKEYQEQVNRFYIAEHMSIEDVDSLITSLAIDHYLTPVSLQVSDISSEEVIHYQEYLAKLAEGNKEGATTTNGDTSSTKQKNTKRENVKVYNVSLNVKGTVANLQAMVNTANQMKTLRVNSVNYTNQANENKDMIVTFKLFMI